MDTSWKKIDSARTIGDATLLRTALEHEGIEVELRGEHRPSIAGSLPMPEAEVEVWVQEVDAARAESVLARLRSAPEQRYWSCPGCSEENPGNFEVCWKCGRELAEGGGPQ